MSEKDEIKKELGLENEKINDYSDELDRIRSLRKIYNSKEGKELLKILIDSNKVLLSKALSSLDNEKEVMLCMYQYKANMRLISGLEDLTEEESIQKELEETVKELAYQAKVGF